MQERGGAGTPPFFYPFVFPALRLLPHNTHGAHTHATPPLSPHAPLQIFEACAPGLKLVAGTATWEGIPFMTSAGPCTCPSLKEGGIK